MVPRLKISIPALTLLMFVFATCKNHKTTTRPELVLQPDPTALFVPDSLRHLLPILDSVWYRDQMYRIDLSKGTPKERIAKQKQFQSNAQKIEAMDNQNLEIVEELLNKYGWLGPRDVGMRGMFALFLTIQHADLKTQEKYLPMIRQAAIDKKVTADSYAMLADRVEIKNKRPQIYGTQVSLSGSVAVIMPLLNPDSVDAWRKSIHLIESLQEYVKRWHIKWDKEEYKKQLPALKKKYDIRDKA